MHSTKMIISSFLLIGLATAIPASASTIAQIEAQPSGTLAILNSNPVVTVIGSAPGSVDGYTYTKLRHHCAGCDGLHRSLRAPANRRHIHPLRWRRGWRGGNVFAVRLHT